jgi:hypothetical protein
MKSQYIFHHHHYYHTLKSQIGGGIHVYSGIRQQGGGLGGVFNFIHKYAIPLISKYILPHAREALVNTASDLVENRSSLKQSIKSNSKSFVKNVGKSLLKNLTQKGEGKKKSKRKSTQPLSKARAKKSKRPTNACKKLKLSKVDFLS